MLISLWYLVPASAAAAIVTHNILPKFGPMFIKAGLFGIDMSKKKDPGREAPKVPEAAGVITGCVFLMTTFLLIPLTVSPYFGSMRAMFPHAEFA